MPWKKTFCAWKDIGSCCLLETLPKIDIKKDLCTSGETEDPGNTAGKSKTKTDGGMLVNCACASNARETTIDVFDHAHREVRAALP
jgi:hypothetical protein